MQMENASLLAIGPYLRNPFLSLEHMNITDFLKNLLLHQLRFGFTKLSSIMHHLIAAIFKRNTLYSFIRFNNKKGLSLLFV